MKIVVPCARGTESLVAAELGALGVREVAPGRAEVSGDATYAEALRVCLWSRVASRVLLPIIDVEAPDADALYAGLRELPFEEHLEPQRTFAIECTLGPESGEINHSQFAALRAKDALVDRLREVRGARPDVDREKPDLRFHLFVSRGRAELAIDLAGEALHRRGYRTEGRVAPLKENLAAALLLSMEWPRRAAAGEPLCDPMCGSGTILIEAAMIAGDRAPGLLRQRWGFTGWAQHDPHAWAPLVEESRERARAGLRILDGERRFFGLDADGESIAAATRNAEVAGLAERISWTRGDLDGLVAPSPTPGLVLSNPPYGERLGDVDELVLLYRRLGDVLKRGFVGWTAGIFTAQGPLPGAIGLRPRRREIFWNGPIECRLLDLPLSAVAPKHDEPAWRKVSQASEMFANRVLKNLKHLGKWAKREHVSCYRVYDADLPEYAVAVDLYEGVPESGGPVERHAHVQEYAAPSTVDPGKAEKRLADLLARLPEVLQIPPEHVVHKLRRRQKPTTQYEAARAGKERLVIEEGGHRFLVNLHDYLDTGVFLDQRQLRKMFAASARGRDVLNLYSYTGSASVYAAKGGATSTTSVDLSNTYLAWAEDNFALNELDPRTNRLVQDDCTHWMTAAATSGARYGLILLAPPTFSNSKRMESTLDVQRDHQDLINACMRLLTPDGEIYFVNHFRRFKMDAPGGVAVEEITKKTLPPDFARDARLHNAWRLRRG